jgi:hypothetical protein
MPILTFDELVGELEGAGHDLSVGVITKEQLIASAEIVGAQDLDAPGVTRDMSATGIRMPGTKYTIGIASASLAILRLAWTIFKVTHGNGDVGDALNIAGVVDQISRSVNSLDIKNGEFCTYIALSSTHRLSNLLRGEYATTADVTDVLRERGADWCGLNCRYHLPDAPAFGMDEVQASLAILASKGGRGVVKRINPDRWRIVL